MKVTYQDILNSEEIKTYIRCSDRSLTALG